MDVIFIRGLPGSGKTTYAKNRYPNRLLIEADQFFVKNGVYKFDKSQIVEAHLWAQKQVVEMLDKGKKIVCCNTFSRCWELQKYVEKLPTWAWYSVISLSTQFTNVHEVPPESIALMRERWEAWPGEVIVK